MWSLWCEIMDDCEHTCWQAGKLSLFTMWQVGMLWQAATSREWQRVRISWMRWKVCIRTLVVSVKYFLPTWRQERGDRWENKRKGRALMSSQGFGAGDKVHRKVQWHLDQLADSFSTGYWCLHFIVLQTKCTQEEHAKNMLWLCHIMWFSDFGIPESLFFQKLDWSIK